MGLSKSLLSFLDSGSAMLFAQYKGEIISINEANALNAVESKKLVCAVCGGSVYRTQGEVQFHHFRHSSGGKHNYKNTKRECEHSLFSSIRMMVRQLIERNKLKISIPGYAIRVYRKDDFFGGMERRVEIVAHNTAINLLKDQEMAARVFHRCSLNKHGFAVDVMLGLPNDVKIALYFTYPGRSFGDVVMQDCVKKQALESSCAVIEVSLWEFLSFVRRKLENTRELEIKELLIDYLQGSEFVRWLYFPPSIIDDYKKKEYARMGEEAKAMYLALQDEFDKRDWYESQENFYSLKIKAISKNKSELARKYKERLDEIRQEFISEYKKTTIPMDNDLMVFQEEMDSARTKKEEVIRVIKRKVAMIK